MLPLNGELLGAAEGVPSREIDWEGKTEDFNASTRWGIA
jgi:hypothetical protein